VVSDEEMEVVSGKASDVDEEMEMEEVVSEITSLITVLT
jgi:hypothetical protein